MKLLLNDTKQSSCTIFTVNKVTWKNLYGLVNQTWTYSKIFLDILVNSKKEKLLRLSKTINLYIKVDALLLADMFENIWNKILESNLK